MGGYFIELFFMEDKCVDYERFFSNMSEVWVN